MAKRARVCARMRARTDLAGIVDSHDIETVQHGLDPGARRVENVKRNGRRVGSEGPLRAGEAGGKGLGEPETAEHEISPL